MLPVLFGLSSALSWGAADFCGGLASRKGKAYQVVLPDGHQSPPAAIVDAEVVSTTEVKS